MQRALGIAGRFLERTVQITTPVLELGRQFGGGVQPEGRKCLLDLLLSIGQRNSVVLQQVRRVHRPLHGARAGKDAE